MARFFISYARKDGSDVVAELGNRLRILKHEVFQDVHGIPGGSDWVQELEERINWCHILLVIITEEASKSSWIYKEFDQAKMTGKLIIPIIVNNTTLPPYLQSINGLHLQFTDPKVNSLSDVILRIVTDNDIKAFDIAESNQVEVPIPIKKRRQFLTLKETLAITIAILIALAGSLYIASNGTDTDAPTPTDVIQIINESSTLCKPPLN